MGIVLLQITLLPADPFAAKPAAKFLLSDRARFKEYKRGKAETTKEEAENPEDGGLNRALILGLEAAIKIGDGCSASMGEVHVQAADYAFRALPGEISGRVDAAIAAMKTRGWGVRFCEMPKLCKELAALASGERFGG